MTPRLTLGGEPIRIVLVTMDSHLSSVTARVAARLATEIPGLDLVLHAADQWDSAEALQTCHDDIARGDIIVATMMFMDDHIRAVQPALAARRNQCDAMLCCMSAGEMVKLTRMGKFDMAGEAKGPMAMLKKLRGKSDGKVSAGQAQMKMLRRLPKIMRFIPGTAQDVRAYFLALQYWLAASEENLANLVRLLVDRYAAGPRLQMAAVGDRGRPDRIPRCRAVPPGGCPAGSSNGSSNCRPAAAKAASGC